ncbi:putative cysteine-rich receptor-like protein kinase 23 [Nymphaea thermarum]|nr:putative cysteine-rich receptor-like protein kinase 23 [Nymphaea thermarum]
MVPREGEPMDRSLSSTLEPLLQDCMPCENKDFIHSTSIPLLLQNVQRKMTDCSVWTVPDGRYIQCPSSATFTAKSTYQQNLNELLLYLTEYGPRAGFSKATKGTDPDQVYGLVLCRGDISTADCKNCLGFAATASTSSCRLGKITFYYSCAVETVADPNLFYKQLGALMQNLSAVAVADPSRMFAVGKIGYYSSQAIYGLVQCKRDLSSIDCGSCLGSTVASIQNNCAGKQAGRFFGYSCDIRYEAYPFALGSASASPPATAGASPGFVRPPPPPKSPGQYHFLFAASIITKHGLKDMFSVMGPLAWILPLSVLMVSLLFIGLACLLWRGAKRRRERKYNKADGFDCASLMFGLGTIRAATNNFSELNKIGQGGFGLVYRGKLPNGQAVAVKRLSSESGQGTPEFQNEVQLVAKLQHKNLVRLLGCCTEGGERILIDYHMNADPNKREQLWWEARFSIIEGIAKGLLYLHEDSRLRIIHRDLKADNILLDEELKPKISDFGLARLFQQEVTHESTSKIAGTCGYMAPEYAISGLVSTKADVFSFGVLLLEIVSGQRITTFHQTELAANFLSYAWRLWREGKALDLIDPTIIGTCQSHETLRCIQIGLLCIQEDARDRPTMAMVALMFGSPSMTLPAPSAPPLFFETNGQDPDVATEGPKDAANSSSFRLETSAVPSINEMTISELEARLVASFIVFLLAAASAPVSRADYLSKICSTKSNYTTNSSYQRSLGFLLGSLERNASDVGFYSATSGQVPDQVHGLFLCRGDITGESCRNCVSLAATQILRLCPNSKTAIIWFDYCHLRYSDVNFLGTLDTIEKVYLAPNTSDTIPTDVLNRQVGFLLSNLSSAATADQSGIMFASGVIPFVTLPFANLTKIYGMVQCTGDISIESCNKCLKSAISDRSRCCKGKDSARILTGSCIIRYELYPFLYTRDSEIVQEGDRRPISANCSTTSDYTANSTYQQNVNHLLLNLAANASYTDFYSATYGEGPDQAYALFLCRGDISGEECRNCTLDAAAKIRLLCPNSMEAIIWFFKCHVRYSNINFFGKVDTNDKAYLWNVQDVIPPALFFNLRLQSLLANLTSNATIARSGRMFATGVVPFNDLSKIYGLVQCTRDITLDGCISCLKNAVSDIPYCCGGKQGGRVLSGSCNLRYELYSFFKETPPPPSLPTSPVQPPLISLPPPAADSSTRRLRRKGKLPNSNEIAAKRLKNVSGQGTAQFRNELQLLAKLAHRNLVRLLGYCIESGESVLVYEYMPNGSLKDLIFGPAKSKQIDWAARTKFIFGIARGLLYLHEESRLKIIHRDLKASNIFLDSDMNPKISGFGVAKLIELEQSCGNMSRMAGTYGYIAPECLLQGQFSTKSDIFSFGVLLLEILSSQNSADFYESKGVEDLLGYAWRLWRANKAMELIDQTLRDSCREFEALRYIHVGLLCVQENAADRPTIDSVILMINNTSVALPMPSAPPLTMRMVQLRLVLLFAVSVHLAEAVELITYDPLSTVCSPDSNYSTNSTYQQNLKILLRSLSSNISGFATATVGQGPDKVYGLALCRGDLTAAECQNCVAEAATKIQQSCSNSKASTIWRLKCELRYSNSNFMGTVSTNFFFLSNVNNATDPILFNQQMKVLLQHLSVAAAANSSSMFASGQIQYNEFQMIYGAVQCTGDLSSANCMNCLNEAVAFLPYCCVERQGAVVIGAACSIRYELYPFLRGSAQGLQLSSPTPSSASNSDKRLPLDWATRVKIITGIARGLLYLHEDSRLKIIHRDLKPSNVLLDNEMNPKISDFGMAKICGMDETHGNTKRIAGTYGYMSPEYVLRGNYSLKSDVFSFGVLLLEIVSGKKNTSFKAADGAKDLLTCAWNLSKENMTLEMVDRALGESYNRKEALRCIHIGLLCVQEDMMNRPTMSSVVLMLGSSSVTLPAPHPPAFYTGSWSRQEATSMSYSDGRPEDQPLQPLLSTSSSAVIITGLQARNMSSPLAAFFFLAPIFTLVLQSTLARSDPLYHFCPSPSNYTATSTFSYNLDVVLQKLAARTPIHGFSTTTAGKGPEKIYGLALCRGDVAGDDCKACMHNGVVEIRQLCPYQKQGILWYDNCMLRYSDVDFFASMDTQTKFYMWNTQNVSQPELFNYQLGKLMGKLSKEAAERPSFFTTGDIKFGDALKIYGLAQCTRDLSGKACKYCIDDAIADIPTCCGGKRGGRVVTGSCSIRRSCTLIVLIALLLPLRLVNMAESPFWTCVGSSTYEANSTFGHNLQRALASLVANVSVTGFYNGTVGKSPDQATAIGGCRGDIDGEACQVCISDAASQVALRCPRIRSAFIVFQACIVAAGADTTIPPAYRVLSLPGVRAVPDPRSFNAMLTLFFYKLIVSATTNPSSRLFWGDKFKYTQNMTIYGMVVCIQLLSPKHCRSCLDIAFGRMLRDAGGTNGGIVYHNAECLLRFAVFPIFTPLPHEISPSSAISVSANCSPPASSNKVGSPFHRNLKALLSHLIVYAPVPGFYGETVGVGSSQVSGQALCRGDISDDVCWECIALASSKIQESCPNSRRAIIWLDHCQLRYSDENFAGKVDVYDRACEPASDNASNPPSFYENLGILVANLTSLVKQSSPNRFFATGVSVLAEAKRIYALAQCVKDIPADQCGWCLQNSSSDIAGCFNGKQSGRILRGSCNLAFGVRPFFSGDPTVISLPQPSHGRKHWWIYVIISFVGVLLLTTACAFCLVRRRKQNPGKVHVRFKGCISHRSNFKKKKVHILDLLFLHVVLENQKQKEATSIDSESAKENEATYSLPQFSLRTVEGATDKFSRSNKLGEGGYGPVYKGKLPDGQEIAVKRLSGRTGQGLKEFRNEVELIAKLQHTNLVRLIGCCLENEEMILIYEYMPNKSLDFFLEDPESRALFDWEKRFNVIIGIARGMLYLHQDSRLSIIHRDLKASNVLLDKQLNPKISDFGLARIFSGVQGQATTSIIVGTLGYMAPEYAMEGVFSTKSDVYSFGILLLEIIGGQLDIRFHATHQGPGLVEHAWGLWREGKGTEFIDPVLKDGTTSTSDQILRCLHIAFLCIQEDPATRPSMSTVVLMLGNNSLDLPLPKQPALIAEKIAGSSLPRSSVIWSIASKSTTEKSCSLIFLTALLLPLRVVNTAESSYWSCIGSSNYAPNSTFGHNLQRALASLVANVSVTGFYNATVGNSPDQAIAAFQCRGDLNGEACQVCVSDAVSQVTLRCPSNRSAVIIFQTCIVYFHDANFTVPQAFMHLAIRTPGAISDPQRFKPMLTLFFYKLIVSATTNPSGRLFWGDKFKYTKKLTIYGIAQCVQSMSPMRCRSCLEIAFGQMLRDAGDSIGGLVYHNIECIVKYRTYPIFVLPPHKISPSSAMSVSSNCSPPASSNKFGSPLHRNINALLSNLIVRAPLSGFYSDTVGLGSSQVYGQALCRGDIPDDVCWECIALASSKIQESCPNSRRAIIWLDHCQLRYSDENFAGKVDVYDRACQPASDNASSPPSFYENLGILVANLTSLVTQSSPNRFFATGVSVLAEAKRIYALAQCVKDIPADQCGWCLQNASSNIAGCFNGKQSSRILRGSCNLAFGVRPFFSGDPTVISLPERSHENQKQKEATSMDSEKVKENEATYNLPQFSLRTVEGATDKFSRSNKLGEGGYGPVYKGKLPSGQEVAVKRLSGRTGQGLKEFRNEVELIAKTQHTNLVRLIGFCLENEEMILIYEYMPNKSLDFILEDPESRASLDWEKRFNIIIGIARGMLYLHQDSRLNIIHRDLKASNVLLDEQLNPKISDFRLARIFSGVLGQATTSIIVGTLGYMAPEYAMNGVYSTKSDVYSFGILLLEIIGGQLEVRFLATHQGPGLIEHAWSLWHEGKGTEFIDPVLKDGATSTSDQMLRCLHIAFLCIQEDPAARPSMSMAVVMLGNNSLDLPLPTQPAVILDKIAGSSLPHSSVLRYSEENFAGTVDVQDRACKPSAENTSNPTSFDENLRLLFSNLTSKAVQSSPNHLFATGKTLFPDSQTIYALVQCVKDISADQCGWCLRNASGDIEGCFNGREGDRILRGSCSLSFGMQSFFAGYPALISSVQPNHGDGDIDGEACEVCVSDAASQVTLRCPRNRVVAVVLQRCVMYVTDPNFTIPRSFMNVSLQTAEAIPDPDRFKPMLTYFFNNLIISAANPSGRLYWGDSFRLRHLSFFHSPTSQDCSKQRHFHLISTSCFPPPLIDKVSSPFHRNLKALLNKYLIVYAPFPRFYDETVSFGSSQVYGQALCRGDITKDAC